ncbi:ATP-dependent DNA helicase Q4 [Trichonephila inaurata madagascariensis]|uniref:DNA 3'-5' helicase n=1 Tax=Trichonephila inaurata madagascariensis TaxID=2747483 RepID=A0A8X6YHF0_9ARAC|nr:ATP-dependent DNA helicase Q4 [Trichonephila inaurata madagascariensis]
MSGIDENELKILKVQVKTWELEFLRLNSKKPSKEDIEQAPAKIKEAYRNYWKLKSKIESEKNSVWSDKFNKCHQKTKNESRNSSIQVFCNKIKQKSNIASYSDSPIQKYKETAKHKKKKSLTNTVDFSKLNESLEINGKDFANPVGINEELISENNDLHLSTDSLKDQDNLQNVHDVPINGVIEEVNNVDTAIKFDIKTPVRVIESQYVNKRSSNANILYSSINFADSPKTLHFKQDIDENWLKRCNENILKNLELPPCKSSDEISDSSSSQKEYSVESKMHHSPLIASEGFTKTIVPFQTNTKNLEEIPDIIPDESVILNMNNNIDNSPNKNSSGNKIHNAHMNNKSSYQTKSDFELPNSETNDSSEEHKRQGKKRKLSSVTISNTSHKANHLKRKIAAGTLNENYVSLNIKKKKFSRGHRPVNIKKLKWNKWKQLKKTAGNNGNIPIITGCFKCGQLGHWARQCNVSTISKETELFEEENVDDIPLPTLEEAAKLAQEANKNLLTKNESKTLDNKLSSESNSKNSVGKEETHELSDINITDGSHEFLTFDEIDTAKIAVKPLFETTNNGKPISTPDAVYDALKEMGYKKFRDGQESAIMRILCGLSTLVVLPTGSGKSLCYQLPAYMYAKHSKSLAIVVSPLVSLMEDQVTGLPSCIHAVCLHSGMTDIQKNNAMKDITNGVAQILLVSPEAIISRYTFFDLILNSDMPPISFVCIDEVHCISQWSHNFRPSYLQLYKVLTKQLRVKCILGLTATATQSTIKDIISNLDLKNVDESVIGCTNIPQNLLLSVSRDKDKDRALIQLLNGDRFRKCSSIIIYCIRRNETERLAALIRTCMQDEIQSEDEQKIKKTKSKKRCFAWTAEAYHAGLPPPRRRSIQKKFMSGKLRIVIATVAFGMGLDKSDVRAIIHYNMPKNFESYVQEIGRAGRDGLDSHCHLFLDSEGNDLWEQQRHIYSNSIDRHSLRKLLRKVFVPCKCISIKEPTGDLANDAQSNDICPKHEVAFSINETVQELDIKQENISTLLCYLELHSKQWIEILSPTYATCTIRCYGGSKQLHAIALKNPAIATAIALDTENGKQIEMRSNLTFPIIKIASMIGWKSAQLKRDLKQLEWNGMKRKTGVMVEFSDLAFHVLSPGNLSGEENDAILDFLHSKVLTTEKTELQNLTLLFSMFQKYSFSHYWECCDEINLEYSEGIKASINKYFARSDLLSDELSHIMDKTSEEISNEVDISYVKSLIKELINIHHDQNFTGRAVARIFHGITSPCFPSEVWGKVRKFWRCLLHVNFNIIIKLANEELRNLR